VRIDLDGQGLTIFTPAALLHMRRPSGSVPCKADRLRQMNAAESLAPARTPERSKHR
jgi:hypothetical protein